MELFLGLWYSLTGIPVPRYCDRSAKYSLVHSSLNSLFWYLNKQQVLLRMMRTVTSTECITSILFLNVNIFICHIKLNKQEAQLLLTNHPTALW